MIPIGGAMQHGLVRWGRLPGLVVESWRNPGTMASKEVWMSKVVASVKRFLVSEDGPTAVEYAVMLALIIVVCIAVITQIGTSASNTFNTVNGALS
jgi:pilus assembly protein Flp/PilA